VTSGADSLSRPHTISVGASFRSNERSGKGGEWDERSPGMICVVPVGRKGPGPSQIRRMTSSLLIPRVSHRLQLTKTNLKIKSAIHLKHER
jgi:hypothetical protein